MYSSYLDGRMTSYTGTMPVPVVSVGGGLGSSCLDGRMTSYAGAPPDRQLDGEGLELLLLLWTVFYSITTK